MKKGGGGTGLLYGASDKSSSSSKKLGKKGSASSNSSGIKDLHAGPHSANSSSEKSDQRHFDRLLRRNEILDFYEFPNEQADSEKQSKEVESIKDNKRLAINDQMSEIQEAEVEGDETNTSPTHFLGTGSKEKYFENYINDNSEEKKLTESYPSTSNEKPNERQAVSDSKIYEKQRRNMELLANCSTPDKVPYDYVEQSEESKNITPFKQLETITEQATDLEMDNTNCVKSEESTDRVKTNECFKTPSQNNTKFISPSKIKVTEDHKSFYSSMKKTMSAQSSEINKNDWKDLTPLKGKNKQRENDQIFTPSPVPMKSMKKTAPLITPVKVFESIKTNEFGAPTRYFGKEIKGDNWHSHWTFSQSVVTPSNTQLLGRSKSYSSKRPVDNGITIKLENLNVMHDDSQLKTMYYTHREQLSKKENTSTIPESKWMYSTTESKSGASLSHRTQPIFQNRVSKLS